MYVSHNLRFSSIPLYPCNHGCYVLLIFGLYGESFFDNSLSFLSSQYQAISEKTLTEQTSPKEKDGKPEKESKQEKESKSDKNKDSDKSSQQEKDGIRLQPTDLVGKWRAKLFSSVQLSDVVNMPHTAYTELDGECNELDENHQIIRHVLTGSCEAVVVLETSKPLSLTLMSQESDKQINSVRGIGFAVLPTVRVPGDKDPHLIIRGICSENETHPFSWKLRIFSTGQVTCKEDTEPQEKMNQSLSAWEKKRAQRPAGGKKNDAKARSVEPQVVFNGPPVIDESVLSIVGENEEGEVLTKEQVDQLIPASTSDLDKNEPDSPTADPGEGLRNQIANLSTKVTEDWENVEQKRTHISKLYTPPPPPTE